MIEFFIFIPAHKVKKVNFEERETTLEYCEAREGTRGWVGIY
jgi:hypothetical protein